MNPAASFEMRTYFGHRKSIKLEPLKLSCFNQSMQSDTRNLSFSSKINQHNTMNHAFQNEVPSKSRNTIQAMNASMPSRFGSGKT